MKRLNQIEEKSAIITDSAVQGFLFLFDAFCFCQSSNTACSVVTAKTLRSDLTVEYSKNRHSLYNTPYPYPLGGNPMGIPGGPLGGPPIIMPGGGGAMPGIPGGPIPGMGIPLGGIPMGMGIPTGGRPYA